MFATLRIESPSYWICTSGPIGMPVNPTAGTVRQLTNLAMEARALGPEFAGVANQIIQQAGRIKDSIGDARAEVGYFASVSKRRKVRSYRTCDQYRPAQRRLA